MGNEVVERHGGEVPRTMDALVQLPGVGRKTANVVLGHALRVPGLPVDRHVLVSRTGSGCESDDPEIVDQRLCAAIPQRPGRERSEPSSSTAVVLQAAPLCDRCTVHGDCNSTRT